MDRFVCANDEQRVLCEGDIPHDCVGKHCEGERRVRERGEGRNENEECCTCFSRPSMKASNGSSDESESPHSDFLLDGLSGAGMYSSWECCCSSSSSKYLRHGQKARVNIGWANHGRGTPHGDGDRGKYVGRAHDTHSSSVLARFFGTPHTLLMAE